MKDRLLKNLRLVVSFLVLILVIAGVLLIRDLRDHSKTISACGFRDDKTVSVGSQKIKVEVASTDTARQKGLSGRACIGRNEGMLFVFNKPGQYSFWMKDMKFPIDIIWIGADHKTAGVERDVEPSTYFSKYNLFQNKAENPAQYVLELASNRSLGLKINLGTAINF